MKRRYSRPLTPATAVFCFLMLTGAQARADTQAQLDAAIEKIDGKLYEQSEADIRAWLDARIARYGDFGVYPDLLGHARVEGDRAHFHLSRGGICDAGAQLFRAYEMLGDKKYLAQALKTADALLAVQQPNGHFAGGPHTVDRNGRVSVGGDRNLARIQDGSQFRPFAFVLYAYRHTGRQKYLDAAKRCADLFVKHIQDPKYGWCGDVYNAGALRRHRHYESDGGSYNDYATTDPMRMTIMMYHVTRDRKYLVRTAKIGQWMFETQLGKGKVRGWCQQYKADNTPAGARGFEGAVIGPRTFNRFTGPMLTWFYGMTGNERYRTLLAESYRWLKAQEHPDDYPLGGGWAYQYLPDGSEVFTWKGKIHRYDQPKTWPQEWTNAPWKKINRAKVQVTDTEKVLAQLKFGGRDALRQWYRGPKKYSPQEYLAVRLAAARRCTDEDFVVPLRGKALAEGVHGRVMGKYLQRVRQRLARPDAPGLPKEGTLHRRKGLDRQSWHSIHTWNEPYRPPYGWAQWQYVWDVRLATGKIDPDTAVTGGRGLEVMHYWPRWDVQGDWTARCIEVEDWMDVPITDSREREIPPGDATSVWGYYGVPPESPDGKRLCYAVYPEPIDLARKERYPVYPAELWVCTRDGGGHRMLYKGRNSVHNGFSQSWVDNTRIVFAGDGATRIVNADTGKAELGPFARFTPAHAAVGGKVLMHPDAASAKQPGLYELDVATGKLRLALPYTKSICHAQYSPDGRKALFTTNRNTNLVVVNLDPAGLKVLPGKKPMHFQWFDNRSFFGYVHKGVVGVDPHKHRDYELYRWDLEGKIVEHLAGHGCHGAARGDRKYFVGESWYRSKPIALRLYARGRREPLTTIFSHPFFQVIWQDGGRHHVNPSFSRDGARVYYNKAVNENTSHAFCYDLTGLVEPMK